jgi:glutaredoxin
MHPHPYHFKVMATKRLTLIGKPGCHLCDDARDAITRVIAELSPELAVELNEHSILDNEELRSRYADEIPVVLIDGRVHTIWRVDPARLSAALQEESE